MIVGILKIDTRHIPIFWNIMHSVQFWKSFSYLTTVSGFIGFRVLPLAGLLSVHLRADDQFHPPHQPTGENAVGDFKRAA